MKASALAMPVLSPKILHVPTCLNHLSFYPLLALVVLAMSLHSPCRGKLLQVLFAKTFIRGIIYADQTCEYTHSQGRGAHASLLSPNQSTRT